MLATKRGMYVETEFETESELEKVVQDYATELFGERIIYLPQQQITTAGGKGTRPDAIVVDLEGRRWYLVEVELAHHGTWQHIAPQVSRQMVAVSTPGTIDALVTQCLARVQQSIELREHLKAIGVPELQVHAHIDSILRRPPVIAMPIDDVPADLADWVRTLRLEVRIWLVRRYEHVSDGDVIYAIPNAEIGSLVTVPVDDDTAVALRTVGSAPLAELYRVRPDLVGQAVYMNARPKGGALRRFDGILRQEGVEVDGKIRSLSYAAVHCLRQTGSRRETANGWSYWRIASGETLGQLYQKHVQGARAV